MVKIILFSILFVICLLILFYFVYYYQKRGYNYDNKINYIMAIIFGCASSIILILLSIAIFIYG